MQRQRSRGFRIKGHASMSFRPDATPLPRMGSSAAVVSRLRRGAFRDHGRKMKNSKG
jgi:hypothetical protein